MEKLDTLIHVFEFNEDTRSQLAFSDPSLIRLDPNRHVVELKPDGNGQYPTGDDIYVISPLFQPTAVRQWRMLQSVITHVKDGLDALTSDGYRLHDGTNQYWWDGAAWSISTSNWNTEADINAHIASFLTTQHKLRVVIKLKTSMPTATPSLSAVKLAWKSKTIHYLDDIVYRSLVPALQSIRFITNFVHKVAFPGGTTLNVGSVIDAGGIPFSITDADSIFDHTADPTHEANKLSSYNPSTKLATLSSSIPVGNMALIQLWVEPSQVAVEHTNQDFIEVEKVPALAITDMSAVDSAPLSQDDSVVNKATGDAVRIRAPYRFDIRFTMIALAPGASDLMRMIEAIVGYVEGEPLLHSPSLDRSYRLWLVDEFTSQTRPNKSDLHSASCQMVIKDVLAFTRPAIDEVAVMNLKLRGDSNVNIPFSPED